jgi:hypothetical protein
MNQLAVMIKQLAPSSTARVTSSLAMFAAVVCLVAQASQKYLGEGRAGFARDFAGTAFHSH